MMCAALTMLTRLEAEEAMAESERVAMGSGSYQQDTQRVILDRWQRQAQPSGSPSVAQKPTEDDLAVMGVGVRRVPRARQSSPPAASPA